MAARRLVLALATLLLFAVGKPNCRCLCGEDCWPRDSDFTTLAYELSQPLVHPLPPESACHPSPNSAECLEAMNKTMNGVWRSNQVGGMQSPNFETYIFQNGTIEECHLNMAWGIPCKQGSVPSIGVDARTVQDIQAAVKFASKHNLRLVVKSTGHDFLGRSTARGSFLLWTHHMKNITFNPLFVPEGAPTDVTHDAIVLDAGVQWYEAYNAVRGHNRAVVGGYAGTVGTSGGWIMGGGHSALSPTHGLGIDNVLQFNVVIASGECLTVNSYQHSDLFWALRGGGGSSYAIVTSIVYKTHPIVPMTSIDISTPRLSRNVSRNIKSRFVGMMGNLSDMGWSAYGYFAPDEFSCIFFAQNVSTAEEANKTLSSLIEYIGSETGRPVNVTTASFASFNDWFSVAFNPQTDASGKGSFETASRFVYREMASQNPGKVVDILAKLAAPVGITMIGGGAVSRVDPDSAGVHPDWRKALAIIILSLPWREGDPASTIAGVKKRLRSGLDVLSGLGRGTYFNEASLYERNFKEAFFGEHYDKLRQIKKQYDSNDLFIVASGVGSDDWDPSLNCRIKTPVVELPA